MDIMKNTIDGIKGMADLYQEIGKIGLYQDVLSLLEKARQQEGQIYQLEKENRQLRQDLEDIRKEKFDNAPDSFSTKYL